MNVISIFKKCLWLKAVPVRPIKVSGWKDIPINPIQEPLIPVGKFARYPYNLLLTDSVYGGETRVSPYTEGLKGSLLTVFIRESVANRLIMASNFLPRDCFFVVWDAFRPLAVQKALFDYYCEELKQKGIKEKDLMQEAQRFVSLPSENPYKPSPHNTGAVVDLSIIRLPRKDAWDLRKYAKKTQFKKDQERIYRFEMRKSWIFRNSELLPMGTYFDEVSPKTASNYYEIHRNENRLLLKNRRLLYSVMVQAGFENYEEEWWHFSYGDQFWAKKRNCFAIYGPAMLSENNFGWEAMRRRHYEENHTILNRLAHHAMRELGDYRCSSFRTCLQLLRMRYDLTSSLHPKAYAI